MSKLSRLDASRRCRLASVDLLAMGKLERYGDVFDEFHGISGRQHHRRTIAAMIKRGDARVIAEFRSGAPMVVVPTQQLVNKHTKNG